MLSLYIHIPFCVRKCHYCGFYSTLYSRQDADEYISALRTEAEAYKAKFSNQTFESVYIGGGTPTVLSPDQLADLIAIIKVHFNISRDAEWSLEANPNSISAGNLRLLNEQGVNRVSVGVQSFSDDLLKFLGRLHTGDEAVDAFQYARSAGFKNIGMDLIYGIPGQTEARWHETLKKAVELKPEHISAYCLSIDEGSQFEERADSCMFALPDDESVAVQYQLTLNELGKAGYEQYEISNFALPGFACRHNLNYWQRGQYLGLGPGSWSFIDGRRYHTISDLREYCIRLNSGSSAVEEEEVVDPWQAATESVMLGLRTSRGLDLAHYEREYGTDPLKRLANSAAPLKHSGLLEEIEGRLRLTRGGFLVANEVLARLST